MNKNLDEFLAAYNPDGEHPLTEIDISEEDSGHSPFIVIRHKEFTAIVNPLAFEDHLCIDLHPFVDGEDATAGVFGMSNGSPAEFRATGTTSHGWSSANLVAVVIGEQR